MTIAGLAVGATQGYIYLRVEYPHAHKALNAAIAKAYAANYLGDNIQGSGKKFDLEVRLGAGAYVCGEETALMESLEGRRGLVRFKPPLPAISGLFGKPTVVNNVISLASVPIILDKGGEYYRDFGMGRSRGTLPLQLAGNLKYTGLVEIAFGLTLRELLYDFGGGSASGRPIKAVQVGGPLGAFVPESQFDTPLDYEAFAANWTVLGHGGVVAFDDTANMAELARYSMEFCAAESCGKCTPCRIGSTRGMEVMDDIIKGHDLAKHVPLLRDLCNTLLNGSLCALGGMTPYPVLSALNHFPEDFGLIVIFDKPDQEDAYKEWVSAHQNGYVINHYRDTNELNLHLASCGHLGIGCKEGTSPTTKHRKICSVYEKELRNWAIQQKHLYDGCNCLN
jgi:formate dehydrogenase iron-sulfur subunit